MSNKPIPTTDSNSPLAYQIRLQGHLGDEWTNWFEGLTFTLEANGDTLLTGPVVDQAALYGLLRKARDLGMPLLAVNCIESGSHQSHKSQKKKKVGASLIPQSADTV